MNQLKTREFLRGEFIGRQVVVCDAAMKPVAGGKIVWETKNMIHVGEQEKRFPKRSYNFIFKTEEGNITVQGKKIMFRPEDRIKRLR